MGHLPEREVCYMRRHIDFDKIGITDDVMFCTVLSNSEDCREFLQRIPLSSLSCPLSYSCL